MKSVNVEPDWANVFKAAEAQLKAQDFDGQSFVLEMLRFGMRCYERLERDRDYLGQQPVWAVGVDSDLGGVKEINKGIKEGLKELERK